MITKRTRRRHAKLAELHDALGVKHVTAGKHCRRKGTDGV